MYIKFISDFVKYPCNSRLQESNLEKKITKSTCVCHETVSSNASKCHLCCISYKHYGNSRFLFPKITAKS